MVKKFEEDKELAPEPPKKSNLPDLGMSEDSDTSEEQKVEHLKIGKKQEHPKMEAQTRAQSSCVAMMAKMKQSKFTQDVQNRIAEKEAKEHKPQDDSKQLHIEHLVPDKTKLKRQLTQATVNNVKGVLKGLLY